MPYISQKRKDELLTRKPLNAGDLTYLMFRDCLNPEWNYVLGSSTRLALRLNDHIKAFLPESPRYADYATVIGCLRATRLELERRGLQPPDGHGIGPVIPALDAVETEFYAAVVGPYEAQKLEQNGDVECA